MLTDPQVDSVVEASPIKFTDPRTYQKSGIERKQFVEQQFQKAIDGQAKRRTRLFENLNMYWGDQIPWATLQKMEDRDREAVVHNIMYRKVTGLVGSLMRNDYLFKFLPLDGKNSSLIHAVEDLFAIDREWFDFDFNLMKLITYGLIHEGVMELNLSDRISPIKNLQFEVCQPGTVVLDNNWRTDNSWDMQEAFKYRYLTPTQLMDIYAAKDEQIKEGVLSQLRNGSEYDERGVDFSKNYENRLGTAYQVIEYTQMVNSKITTEIDLESGCALPVSDDPRVKMAYIQANGINPEYIRAIEHTTKICRVTTICPDLCGEPLEDRDHPIQIKRLPYFPYAAERIGGQPRGIVDIIRDLQKTLNKRENNLNHIIESSAKGGGALDPAIVGNDPKLKRLIQDNWADPQFKFWTQEGALANNRNYFAAFPKSPAPNEVFAQINQLWDSLDRVIPLNPAAEGRVESSQEPGILFSLKTQAIEIAQTSLNEALHKVLTEMGEAYLMAAKQQYKGVERTFSKADGSKIVINEMVPLPNGDVGIKNDISALPICRMTVKTGPDSPNSKFSRRLLNLDLLNIIPPEYQQLRAAVIREILGTIEMSDQYRTEIDNAVNAAYEVAKNREEADIANSQGMVQQLNAAQQQAGQAAEQQALQQQVPPTQVPVGPQGEQPQGTPPQGQGNPMDMMSQMLGPLLSGAMQGQMPQGQ